LAAGAATSNDVRACRDLTPISAAR
jgi:hypothetical protein